MAYQPYDPIAMDLAAEEAEKELNGMPQTEVIPLARWFAAYYLKAGHKRLGRMLVQVAKNTKNMNKKDWTTEEDLKQ